MFRWLLLGLTVIACAGLVFWAVYLKPWPWGQSGPFWDKYQQVQFGMTEQQVRAILGPETEQWGGALSEM